MLLEKHFVLQLHETVVHLVHEGVDMAFFECDCYFLQHFCLDLSLQSLYVVEGHVVHIVVEAEEAVHQFPELACFGDFGQPLFEGLSWEEDFPPVEEGVPALAFHPEPHLLDEVLAFVGLDGSFFVLGLVLHLFIDEHHFLKTKLLRVELAGRQSLVLLQLPQPVISGFVVELGTAERLQRQIFVVAQNPSQVNILLNQKFVQTQIDYIHHSQFQRLGRRLRKIVRLEWFLGRLFFRSRRLFSSSFGEILFFGEKLSSGGRLFVGSDSTSI